MSRFLTVPIIFLCCNAVLAALPPMWQSSKPAVISKNGRIALSNGRTAVVFDAGEFTLQALYHADLPDSRVISDTPLWQARMLCTEQICGMKEPRFHTFPAKNGKVLKIDSGVNPDGSAFITAVTTGQAVRNLRYTANITVTLRPDEDMPRWRLTLDAGKKGQGALWTVDFPRISFKNDPKAPLKMALPYRNGILASFPYNFAMPYPGAAVKFQMMSCYDTATGAGEYLACEDDQGYNKGFCINSYAGTGETLFYVIHYPEDRFNAVKFEQKYDVVCGARRGDWFDDARRYRRWFTGCEYAAKGPVIKRQDIPRWLKDAAMSAKISTSKKRTVANNVRGAEKIAELVNDQPVLAIWYEFEQRKEFYDGIGRPQPLRTGVTDALKAMNARNFHTLAYIQSQIYDYTDSPETAEAEKHMIRDFFGNLHIYHRWAACRYTPWWQQRFCDLSKYALDQGFQGIYLDSFGKSNAECFRVEHGHGQGGGNYITAGQRQLAHKLRTMLKSRSNDLVMSGEAPVEAFTDLLDYYLLAVNVLPDGIPLWRAIAGDYVICHGRMMSPGRKKDSIIGETAILFLDGTIPGRLNFYGGRSFLDQPEFAEDKKFVQKIIAAIAPTLDYLRLGEMLRIPELSPAPEKVTFHEYINGKPVIRPGVMARCYRSHQDNSRCVVLVNISSVPWSGKVKLDDGSELTMSVDPRDVVWKFLR